MVTNAKLEKKFQEQEVDNKWLGEELEKLKDYMKKIEKNFIREQKNGDKEETLIRMWKKKFLQNKGHSLMS